MATVWQLVLADVASKNKNLYSPQKKKKSDCVAMVWQVVAADMASGSLATLAHDGLFFFFFFFFGLGVSSSPLECMVDVM